MDRAPVSARLFVLAISGLVGCAGAANPDMTEVKSSGPGPLAIDRRDSLERDLTIQALHLSRRGDVWRGIVSEPRAEDELRGLYLPMYPEAQAAFLSRLEHVFGVAIPHVRDMNEWAEGREGQEGVVEKRAQVTGRVPHLRVFLVETHINNFGYVYDLSVVVLPAHPSASGSPLVVFDDFVLRDVEVWLKNELSGGERVSAAMFVIDRAVYPPGSRHYVYSRDMKEWPLEGTRAASAAIVNDMLSHLRQDLVRDGFLSR
jgi:hypothetical protein